MSIDSFTAHLADKAREDIAEGHEHAARLTRQARGFTPVPAYQTLLAEGDSYEDRKAAVDMWAYMHGIEADDVEGGYAARIKLPGFHITVMAVPVRADRPAPVAVEDEGITFNADGLIVSPKPVAA